MNLIVNGQPREMPDGSSVADVLLSINAQPPFAVAVNTTFVPSARHDTQLLKANDRVEVISPVTGG